MAHKPSFLPVLKKFGLEPEALAIFLKATRGIIAGSAPSSAFFGKNIEDDQDLDIWIPLPDSTTSTLQSVQTLYAQVVENNIYNFFTRNQQQPNKSSLLSKSLNQIVRKYRGVYQRTVTSDLAEYTQSNIADMIERIDVFENPWTGRRIQVICTLDFTPEELLSNFDLDICQFYVDGSDPEFIVKHNHSADVLTALRRGNATILSDPTDTLTEYQLTRLENRIAKYESHGYMFKWQHSGIPWTQISDAPTESFWQDFILTTADYRYMLDNHTEYDTIYQMLDDAGCNFKGADTAGTINTILSHIKKQTPCDEKDCDVWEYTWRFTWDADSKLDNIYIKRMLLLNPF